MVTEQVLVKKSWKSTNNGDHWKYDNKLIATELKERQQQEEEHFKEAKRRKQEKRQEERVVLKKYQEDIFLELLSVSVAAIGNNAVNAEIS